MKLRLYHYWRSTSSWRVRWGLAHKGIDCEFVPVSLLDGESESPAHLARHPLGFVPVLERLDAPDEKSRYLTESIAILEWLEETHPERPLLPRDPWARAQVRALTETINADTQPIQNLSVQIKHSDDPEARKAWAQHWIRNGLAAYEKLCARSAGKFSLGDSLTIADLCLVPQAFNAERFGVSLAEFPVIQAVVANAKATPSCAAAEPEKFRPPGFKD